LRIKTDKVLTDQQPGGERGCSPLNTKKKGSRRQRRSRDTSTETSEHERDINCLFVHSQQPIIFGFRAH
jgi:hypothetical protein